MKRIVLCLSLLLLCAPAIAAQDKKDDIKKLIGAMEYERLLSQTMDNFQQLQQQTLQSTLPKTQREELNTYVKDEAMSMMRTIIDQDLVSIYDKYFTQDEIRQMVKFYTSPVGKKLVRTQPDLQQEMFTILSTYYLPAFQVKIKKKLDDLMEK